MAWMQKLYETYENNLSQIGNTSEDENVLLPICHTTQKAHIAVTIFEDGSFMGANIIDNQVATTIIPCTEASGGRSGVRPENHPLCDKLQYLAGDFLQYGGEVTIGYRKNPIEPFEKYIKTLEEWNDWCNKNNKSHPKLAAILKYTKKKQLVQDLIDEKILVLSNSKTLLKEWKDDERKDKPEIFKVLNNVSQHDAFIRWRVLSNNPQTDVWTDTSLHTSWIEYYSSQKSKVALCYITGEEKFEAVQHPAKIRNNGDQAKLISSNDTSGFTFRGRFTTAEQACGISYEVTQKAHNALKWLLRRQGYINAGGMAVLAWATSGKDIPRWDNDSDDLLSGLEETNSPAYTAEDFARKLNKRIAGYNSDLSEGAEIVVMGLDAATPGRMSLNFYRELNRTDFLEKIESWHKECSWKHAFKLKELEVKGKVKKVLIEFFGVPSPRDIAEAAYGAKIDEKLRNATVKRILSCIVDKQKIPLDLVQMAVRRASNRVALGDFEWNKVLSIACSLVRKMIKDYYDDKEDVVMALDVERKKRDYLYGRLLAVADDIESWALNHAGEKRPTTATRYMNRFGDRPFTTWKIIHDAMIPYTIKIGGAVKGRLNIIAEIMALFDPDEFIQDKKLSGEYLLGYYCQREELRKRKLNEKQDSTSETDEVNENIKQ
ncbi:MAG: type I-C CRISPR-associated protein Cas8c/Csd1 [Clostridia bacterium]|nr:type I-C CRISPR-associated protein Cas8c/Csd1 [Clostridia bacterium]